MDAAVALAVGAEDERTVDQVRAWLVAYALGELDEDEMPTPAKFRRAMRDRYLRRAGYEIEARSINDRAERLAERVRTFELLRWPVWEPLAEPPRQADAVDALLFRAWKIGPHPIPASARRLNDLF